MMHGYSYSANPRYVRCVRRHPIMMGITLGSFDIPQ
jgi:hypothetical protein